MEEILSRAKKAAEQAELFQVFSKVTPVNFEANRLKEIQAKESTTRALRLIKGGKVGFAQANGFVAPEKLVEMAEETCPFGATAKFDFPGPQDYMGVNVFDTQVEKVTLDSMVQVGEELIEAVTKHTPSIVCEATVTKGIISVNIANSKGGNARYNKSFFNIGLEGVLIKNEDMLFVGDSLSSCHPITDFQPVVEEVIMQLELAGRNAKVTSGLMPAIFTPHGVASALISPLISAFNGKIVFDGASPLRDKLGHKVFNEKFSLWDDSTIPYQVGSYPCDDEGIPAQRTPLIDRGVVSHFIYDLQTAALAGTQSTGNGDRRGGVPAPSPSSFVISKGKTSFNDMVKDIKEGLIIDILIGAEQGNILNGDFSGNVLLGYKIENGEITGRVKDIIVAGNVYQLLKQIETVGNDARWVEGFLFTPSLYCSGLSIASKMM
jgi:PmbA protein